MADAKPKLDSPGLYDPAHDSSLEKMLDAYTDAYDKKHQEGYGRASTLHHDSIYEVSKKHLHKLHGAGEDGHGPAKLHFNGYKNPKDDKDPKASLKAAEEHLNEQLLKAIELRHGKKRADALRAEHKEDPETLKMYANRIFQEANLQIDYKGAVKAIQDSENILADLRDERSVLGQIMGAYTQYTSPLQKKIGKYMDELRDETNREAVVAYGAKKLEAHGKKRGHDLTFKPAAKNSDVLRELAGLSANPDAYMPNHKAKHLRKKPEEKKK